LVFPVLERCKGSKVTNRQKLFAGFVMAALAMLTATFMEIARRQSDIITPGGLMSPAEFGASTAAWRCLPSDPDCNAPLSEGGRFMGKCTVNGIDYCSSCAPKTNDDVWGIYESTLSATWMFLPYALIGLGEILVNPTTQYYAYNLTPAKTRSVIQAVNMVFQGATPSAIVAVFTSLLQESASPRNLNNGHAEYFYYVALAILVVGSAVFLVAQKYARIKMPQESGIAGSFAGSGSIVDSYAKPHGQPASTSEVALVDGPSRDVIMT
jgi:hypothetical protein